MRTRQSPNANIPNTTVCFIAWPGSVWIRTSLSRHSRHCNPSYLNACGLEFLEEVPLERQRHLEQSYDRITETICMLKNTHFKSLEYQNFYTIIVI